MSPFGLARAKVEEEKARKGNSRLETQPGKSLVSFPAGERTERRLGLYWSLSRPLIRILHPQQV